MPLWGLRLRLSFPGKTTLLLTWGGLRGAISIALALLLPRGPERELILTVTYLVVAFSVLAQGSTFGWLLRRSMPEINNASPRATST